MCSGLDMRPVLSAFDAIKLHLGNIELVRNLLHGFHALFIGDHLLDALYRHIGQLMAFLAIHGSVREYRRAILLVLFHLLLGGPT